MRRHKGFKKIKIKLPSFLEDFKKLISKTVASALVMFILLAISFMSARAILLKSNYFRIRIVESKDIAVDELTKLYKGKNVFKIDLKGIAKSLQSSYPDAKEVRVKIVLPDKLVISLKLRKPVAFVNGPKYYPVDEEGYILSSAQSTPHEDLPVIRGVDVRYEERLGRRSESKNLRIALDLLREIKKTKFIARRGIATIDAGDLKNLSFYLRNGLEVRIGSENLKKRLELLQKTLRDPRLLIDRIKYIDVRFEDAVVNPK